MNLVIVESPAKSKTIEKFLGKDYKVLASYGHVRDLPQKELGVDVEKNYAPKYEILSKAKKTVSGLKEYTNKADKIYLATDLDREGEAISWHLTYALGLKPNDPRVKRIVFNEITKSAVDKAIQNPRGLDINLVDAQQARRVLDRLVGYKLSPLLWKKIKKGLSAGRVQSVAVRLVVEREREIQNFKPVEYWILGANLSKKTKKNIFKAFLTEIDGKAVKKFDIKTQADADKIEHGLNNAVYSVLDIIKKESIRKPAAPFTTSTLQMEASRKLGFSPKQTMLLAQKLYEAGKITYMRTDSVNLSEEALKAIHEVIVKEYGEKYLVGAARRYEAKSKHAQEAHEAIRPTHFENAVASEDGREQRLYDLIWKRTVASQMSEAVFDVATIKIKAAANSNYIFTATGEVLKFDGFMRVYLEGKDDEIEDENVSLPVLETGEILDFFGLIKDQKFTEPPKRYSEATLVKKMESLGIGRPSTYAPTLDTIQQRGYVELNEKRFSPSEIGMIVTDLLVEHFNEVVDYQFTAKMEDDLDDVAEGKIKWVALIDQFYKPFSQKLKEKTKEINKSDVMPVEELDEKCPECGKPLIARFGRYGKFVACSGYPECKYSRPLGTEEDKSVKGEEIVSEEKCEKCGGRMLLKEGRFGKFYACENYPKCKTTKAIAAQATGLKCPECKEGDVVIKRTKRGKTFWGCSRYPDCKFASWEKPGEKSDDFSKAKDKS